MTPPVRRLLAARCAPHGVTVEEAMAAGRAPDAVRARLACYRALANAGWSVPQIAALFGRSRQSIHYWLRPAVRAANIRRVAARRQEARGAGA